MPKRSGAHTMWGGRFAEPLDADLLSFTSSIDVDRRLFRWDALASIAHAVALGEAEVISRKDADAITAGLRSLIADMDRGTLAIDGAYEDIHSFLEGVLYERIGAPAGRLPTARSRNDQVATAFRLWLKEQIIALIREIHALMATTVDRAAAAVDIIMPGFTHLQHAQPIRLAHHLLAYAWMFSRDAERLIDAYRRADVLPLGSGAIAGVGFPINRDRVAKMLGFSRVSENSVDATGDRDFALETTSAAALFAIHLSRWAGEIVLWATDEFGFLDLADRVATGSSIMPQKKNPDPAELIRGRSARVMGDLVVLFGMVKGLPAGYHRDLQEDKPATLDALDTVRACARAMKVLLDGVRFNLEKMEAAAKRGWTTATEVADYLVRKGVPFREAHGLAGAIVQRAAAKGVPLWELSMDEYRAVSPLFDADIIQAVTLEAALESKDIQGGTSRRAVQAQLAVAGEKIHDLQGWITTSARTLEIPEQLAAR